MPRKFEGQPNAMTSRGQVPQVTQMHNIQNIQNYHIELPQNIVLKESDIRSLDRIADHKTIENSTQNI